MRWWFPHGLMAALGLVNCFGVARANDDESLETVEGEGIVVQDRSRSEATDVQETSAAVTVIEVDDSLPASSDVSTVVDSASRTT